MYEYVCTIYGMVPYLLSTATASVHFIASAPVMTVFLNFRCRKLHLNNVWRTANVNSSSIIEKLRPPPSMYTFKSPTTAKAYEYPQRDLLRTFSGSPLGNRHSRTISIDEEVEQVNGSQDLVKVQKTSDGRGWGVFANRNFQRGDLVMESRVLSQFQEPTSHSIQIDWNKHVEVDLPSRFVNHRCSDANVGIRPNRHGAYDFMALRSILEDEEVLWDYAASEYKVTESFCCSCGSPECRGLMRGYKFHGDLVKASYGEQFIAPYLLRKNDKS